MKNKPRVVFDTNIFISALIFGGNPRMCLELAKEGSVQLFSSRAILLELADKLRQKFDWKNDDIVDVIEGVATIATIVRPMQAIHLIKQDPADNRILECAQEARADFIISGDKKHLLSLKKFKKTQIISAKEFLEMFYKKLQ